MSDMRGSSRSDFLKQAAGAAAVVAGASAGAGALAAPASAVLFNPKEYKFLEIDGVNVGRLVGASGGDPEFEVITNFDADGNPDKLLGGLTHGECSIRVGAGMSKPVYDWINASFGDPTVRKNGAIVSADFNLREVARRTFTNAQITSFTMPLLVNRPQAIPAMTVTFSAETVSDDTPSSAPVSGPKQKAWLTSNFRFDCPGLPANRVASIDSFHYMFEIVEQPDGSSAVRKNPSDLRCIVDPAGAPAFQQWYDNFALGGDSSDERDATLTVYGLTPQLPLFRANFKRLGINQVVPDTVLRRFNVELYVEQADWDLGKNKGG